jgi:hypothetical protein
MVPQPTHQPTMPKRRSNNRLPGPILDPTIIPYYDDNQTMMSTIQNFVMAILNQQQKNTSKAKQIRKTSSFSMKGERCGAHHSRGRPCENNSKVL